MSHVDSCQFSVNEAGSSSESGARLTHACSRAVRRQLLHLTSVYQGSDDYYRAALRPVIKKLIAINADDLCHKGERP